MGGLVDSSFIKAILILPGTALVYVHAARGVYDGGLVGVVLGAIMGLTIALAERYRDHAPEMAKEAKSSTT